MAFVVDIGSYETRAGFSDEFAPGYVHRSVAGCSTASSSPSSSYSFGVFDVRRQHAATVGAATPSSVPSFRAFRSLCGDDGDVSTVMASAAGRDLLLAHLRHVRDELTNAAAPIAFAPQRGGGSGYNPFDPAAVLPFHFVLPEACFAPRHGGSSGSNSSGIGSNSNSSGGGGGYRRGVEAFAAALLESGACPALYASRPSVAATLASGRASGIVLDVGHSQCTVTAVVDGVALQQSQQRSAAGGAAVNERLLALLAGGGYCAEDALSPSNADAASASPLAAAAPPLTRDQLLRNCYGIAGSHPLAPICLDELCHGMKTRGGSYVNCPTLAEDGARGLAASYGGGSSAALSPALLPMYVAPDGQVVSMPERCRTRCFEVLFSDTENVGATPTCNLGALVTEAKRGLPAELRGVLPLLLCGATSAAGGLRERLLFEMKRHDLSVADAAQLKSANPLVAPLHSLPGLQWGGAALASSSTAFSSLWITRAELEEEGASVLARKLFQ